MARDEPVLLVLEDMHWSDRSTQDFAVALARTLAGRLMLVLTYRTDDLTRRHPFRKAAGEIALHAPASGGSTSSRWTATAWPQ